MKDVFEWADVSLSSAFLTSVRLSGSKTQKDVVAELAAAAGVYIQWDSSEKPKLSGTWMNILKAQVIFTRYLSETTSHAVELSQCSSEDSSVLTVNCNQRKEVAHVPQKHDLQNLQISSTHDRKNVSQENNSERNEVYVNITVSSSAFADVLTQKKNVNLRESSKANHVHLASRVQSSEAKVIPQPNGVSDVGKHIKKVQCDYNSKNKIENFLHFVVREKTHTAASAVKLEIDDPSAEGNAFVCDHSSPDTDHSTSKTNHKNDLAYENTVQSQHSENTSDTEKTAEECCCMVPNDFKVQNKRQTSHSQTPNKIPKNSSPSQAPVSISAESERNAKFSMPQKGSVADAVVCFPVEIKGSNVDTFQGDKNATEISQGKEASEDTNKKVRRKNYEELAPFKFFCSQCSFKSKRESHYQRHKQLHEQVSNIYQCEKCSFKTIRLGNLRRHELTHSESELSCDLCTYRTLHHKLLIRHQRNKHINKLQESEEKEIMKCSQCNYSTTRPYLLERHLKVHSSDFSKNQLVYECSECPYKASRKEHLDRHTSNVHGCHRPFLCHHCGKAFKRPDALKQHSAVHLNHPPFTCPTCDKGCRSRAHLKQHLSVHSARRLFLCELCGASFKTRAVQRKHILTIHHHPKAYSCLNCSRRFNTKYALRRHMKQHLERKHKSGGTSLEINARTTPKCDKTGPTVHLIQHEVTTSEKNVVKQPFGNTAVIINNPSTGQTEGEKVAVQLRNHGSESVQIIPAHAFIQQTNETATALLYLTGSFSSY
ncbi:zinc finger protein 583-like [Schistocerca nitens]|uniref:zinc finger protein 583-like n=1 Tax=Schistocerca nitens TaxID=7011 RepID=UPI0021175884|nr:zinc finger protein 583-like [Schistocerca nitens]